MISPVSPKLKYEALVRSVQFIDKIVGQILNDRLKEKILKLWKESLSLLCVCVFVCVCVCVCPSVCLWTGTGHIFWHRNLMFGLSDPGDMRKNRHLYSIFRCFPYITLVHFWFQATGHSFHLGMWYLDWEDFLPLENWYFLDFLKIHFFTVELVK